MIEPVYTLDDGKKVPYVPIEIKTHRDAYAATLHVLFKHVADFHICIVKAFSKKYGIPEDDIMQTIQESEEFKNMHVDPALDPILTTDPLGYLAKEPVQPVQPVQPVPESDPVIKKRVIKKKTAASTDATYAAPVPETTAPAPETKAPAPETTAQETTAPVTMAPASAPSPIEKKKVIRKKVTNTSESVINEPVITDERTDVIASVSQIAQLLATNVPTTQKKIIRKKTNS